MVYRPTMGASYMPGIDDFSMPTAPELMAPEPQRINPEMSNQIAEGMQNMNLNDPSRAQYTNSYSDLPIAYDPAADLSPFPKLVNPGPNVPPTDDELETRLETARQAVLNSNDPEMQLAWAADVLIYCGVCADEAERVAATKPQMTRSTTPKIEHQLRVDAMNIVTFLASQHHPRAEFINGISLEWGRFNAQDKKEAFRCYSRAADRGYARAEYRIGMLYESYNDPSKALRHYHRGVGAGDAASCYRLGMMTLRGQHGQQQDFTKGLDLIRRSAEAADENAAQGAYVYGMLLCRQLPQIVIPNGFLAYDEQLAKENIEKAAYMKFAKAQAKMGSNYELGALGCNFHPALSMHYNALASKQGEADADMALSKWFLVGSEGLFPKNEQLAYTYAERAAASGLATAEFALGYFSEIGMYVPVSLDKALELYTKASKHGNDDAKGRIDGLARKQVLSKKDHENVAVSRIKSQHGSMRGGRLERLRQQQASQLGAVSEGSAPYVNEYNAVQPPARVSSIAPYPMDDRPPVAPLGARSSSVAPYPLEDGPPGAPSHHSAPNLLAGPTAGFFNAPGGPRPASAVNPELRPSSAFQINPNLQPMSTAANPQLPYASRPYSANPAPPGPRPSTAQPQPYDPRLRPQVGNRVASGPAGLESFQRQQPGPPVPGKLQYQATALPNPQAYAQAAPPQAQPGMNIGFTAPVEQRRPRPDPTYREKQDRLKPQPLNPNHPQAQVQAQSNSRPTSAASARPQAAGARPSMDARRPVEQSSSAAAVRPPRTDSAPGQPPPKKGPKTFEEMGVPAHQKEGDCVVM